MFTPPMEAPLNHLLTALADRYRIERELGAGGMATVYLARDLKHDRDVALQVMKPDVAQSLGAERFLREIQLAAKLNHPHIMALFDSGSAGGALYYVMPNVEGRSLRDRLDDLGQLPVEEAVRIATAVAGALDYAHRRGVVHRDIKPENIMLQDGHALVADFGIGKALTEAGADTLTQAGMSVGTPAYMSPEQAVGEGVDGRSDLYALGCVLYEMLLGEPPFTGPNVQAVIAKRFVQTPADVAGMREGVPRSVARAVQRALARAPIDRYETAAAFATALAEVDAPARGVAPDKSIAVLPFENLSSDRENEYFGDGMAEEIINALAQVEGLRVAARTSAFSFKGKPDDLRVVGEKLGVATVLEGSVRKAGNRIRVTAQLIAVADGYHLWSERYDRELVDVFVVQDEIAAAIVKKLEVTLARSESESALPATPARVEAFELCVRGRALMMRRGRSLLSAIECFERAAALAPDYAPAFAGLGDAHLQASRYALGDPTEHLVLGDAALDRALAIDPRHASALAARGGTTMSGQGRQKDIPGGMALLERALELDPRLSDSRIVLGFGLVVYFNEDARGLTEAERAVRDDPLSAYNGMMRALILSNVGRHAEAMAEAERAFALDAEAYLMHYARVWVRVASGDLTGAGAAVTESLAAFGRDEHLLLMLPAIYVAQGERGKAEAVYRELRARAETSGVLAFALAVCALCLGRADEGMAYALESADVGGFQPLFWLRGWFAALVASHPQYPELRRRLGV